MFLSVSGISLMESFGGEALDRAAAKAGLQRRTAQVLSLMVALGAPTYTNQELQDLFVECKLSTKLSAPKEASICKSKLLAGSFIETRGKVSTVAVTRKGYRAAAMMDEYVSRLLQANTVSERVWPILRGFGQHTAELQSKSELAVGVQGLTDVKKPFVVERKTKEKVQRRVS